MFEQGCYLILQVLKPEMSLTIHSGKLGLRPNLKNLSRGLNILSRHKYCWFRLKLYLIF